mmetsp:Transcript_30314/g.72130  ORF Transcript_30314/g.72130 Transcript_30314/m.72130 type:complete len:438 (-) Transcript_30314:16-1329(-)
MALPNNMPTCPCCAFILSSGDGALSSLPWNQDRDGSGLCFSAAPQPVETTTNAIIDPVEAWETTNAIIDPVEAWEKIRAIGRGGEYKHENSVLLVDSHGHPQLRREAQYDAGSSSEQPSSVVSLACAVAPPDWEDVIAYSSHEYILPALGVHPWYLNEIMETSASDAILSEDCLEEYLDWGWLDDLEAKLLEHPNLLVGEIGLCKMAKFVREFPKEKGGKATAMALQKMVFRRQFELAARFQRPVTVHCVNAHGIMMDIFKDIYENAKSSPAASENDGEDELKRRLRRAFPPAIAMHSFTGTAHHCNELLLFEREIISPGSTQRGGNRRRNKKRETETRHEDSDSDNPIFYFGFSHAVNHLMCTSEKARKKGGEAVRAIPSERLLVESDVHNPSDVALGTAGAASYAANVRGLSLEEIVTTTTTNGLRFLRSVGRPQ